MITTSNSSVKEEGAAQSITRRSIAGAANNTAANVNKSELAWLNFLHYDMMSVVGISVVLLAIFVVIPKARREGQL